MGENSLDTRHLPSDEMKDQVAQKGNQSQTSGANDITRTPVQSGPPPVVTPPRPQGADDRPVPQRGGWLIIRKGQQRYAPQGPFQSAIPLNLESIRAQPDGFFADLHGLKANVFLFQDYIRTGGGIRSFLVDASQKIFRGGSRYCAALSDPLQAPDGRLHGGGAWYWPTPTTWGG